MFLIDTNVFLEILLKQGKRERCKKFLDENIGNLHVTDFSLHSVGVILYKYNRSDVFQKFVKDTLPKIQIMSLPVALYENMESISKRMKLDFDDAYQYSVAKHYGLKVVTMDRDFERVEDVEALFL